MNTTQFAEVVDAQIEVCQGMLGTKGAAYSGNNDVLLNFKRNAENLGLTKYQIWSVYFMKHIDAINSAVRKFPAFPLDKSEGMDGRIVDAINYLLLLKALLVEDESGAQSLDTALVEVPLPPVAAGIRELAKAVREDRAFKSGNESHSS